MQQIDQIPLDWKPNTFYSIGTIIRFNQKLYRVIQEHTSYEGFEPSTAGDLFSRLFSINKKSIPAWEKPIDKKFYKKNEIVSHGEKFWISMIDKNILEPGTIGKVWEEYIPIWENGNSYSFNQKVKYFNKIYLSLMPENKEFPPTSRAWLIIEDIDFWEEKEFGYRAGEKVRYKEDFYKSLIDDNVWSPADYPAGWSRITE